jgi:hypothetical protein
VPTAEAARYVEQLCRHWAHRLVVERSGQDARIVLPSGAVVGLLPTQAALEIELAASTPADLAEAKEVIRSHLDRFAFRESPLTFNWADRRPPG